MNVELVDFRGKLTRETYQVVSGVSHATGRDMSEIVRSVMAGWARDRVHEAEVVLRLAKGEGNRSGGGTA